MAHFVDIDIFGRPLSDAGGGCTCAGITHAGGGGPECSSRDVNTGRPYCFVIPGICVDGQPTSWDPTGYHISSHACSAAVVNVGVGPTGAATFSLPDGYASYTVSNFDPLLDIHREYLRPEYIGCFDNSVRRWPSWVELANTDLHRSAGANDVQWSTYADNRPTNPVISCANQCGMNSAMVAQRAA